MISPSQKSKGILYIVPTPIGNLQDISSRSLEILHKVNHIACEDTRRSSILLAKNEISGKNLISCFKENEFHRKDQIRNLLLNGEDLALISDAGTPGISDPGYLVVKEALANQIKVIPLPGPSAAITALSASGIDSNRFSFLGFLPKKGKNRQEDLNFIASHPFAVVIYESPHRLLKTIKDLKSVCTPQRYLVAAREITKLHEEFVRGSIGDIYDHFTNNPIKGEFTLIIAPTEEIITPNLPPLENEILRLQKMGLSSRDIAAILSKYYNESKNLIYKLTLKT